MNARITKLFAAAVVALGATTAAIAQELPDRPAAAARPDRPGLPDNADRKTLGVLDISAVKSLKTTVDRTGQTEMLDRLVETLGEQLKVAFQDSGRFEVIARGPDLAALVKESALPKGLILDDDGRGLGGRIKGLDVALAVSVTDFADVRETVKIPDLGQTVSRRSVQATAVFKVYDATTGGLLKAVRVPVLRDDAGVKRVPRNADNSRSPDDAIVGAVAEEMAARAVEKVAESVGVKLDAKKADPDKADGERRGSRREARPDERDADRPPAKKD